MGPGEMAEYREGNGKGRIEVGPGDVAGGEDDDHDGQSCTESISEESFAVLVLLVNDWRRRCTENEDECSEELCSKLHLRVEISDYSLYGIFSPILFQGI